MSRLEFRELKKPVQSHRAREEWLLDKTWTLCAGVIGLAEFEKLRRRDMEGVRGYQSLCRGWREDIHLAVAVSAGEKANKGLRAQRLRAVVGKLH